MSDFILYDTEYTSWKGCIENGWDESKGQHKELVQIGAILVDGETFGTKMVLDIHVKPRINSQLSPYFVDLTHIPQEVIERKGVDFDDMMKMWKNFCSNFKTPTFSYGGDETILAYNYKLYHKKDYPFFGNSFDIRKILESIGVDTKLYTSGSLTECISGDLIFSPHNAVEDVQSVRYVLHHFFKEGKLDYQKILNFYGCVRK